MTNSIYIPVDNSLVDVVLTEDTGYPEALAALDTDEAICRAMGETAREFPSSWLVDPKDLKERARYNDEHGLWAEDRWDRFTNQSPTHQCTCEALAAVAEAAWMAGRHIAFEDLTVGERQELSKTSGSVWFSVIGIYCEANPGQWGGANTQQVLNIACNRGFLPDMTQPFPYKFRHAFWGTCGKGGVNQSRTDQWPGWSNGTFKRTPSEWADKEWKETAKHFVPLECVNPKNEQEYDSLLINGRAIGIGRSGHSVPVGRIVWDSNGRKLYRYKDSYDRYLYDSRPYTSGAYSIITMTRPSDWSKPAGI